jgi:hypothetical protein
MSLGCIGCPGYDAAVWHYACARTKRELGIPLELKAECVTFSTGALPKAQAWKTRLAVARSAAGLWGQPGRRRPHVRGLSAHRRPFGAWIRVAPAGRPGYPDPISITQAACCLPTGSEVHRTVLNCDGLFVSRWTETLGWGRPALARANTTPTRLSARCPRVSWALAVIRWLISPV